MLNLPLLSSFPPHYLSIYGTENQLPENKGKEARQWQHRRLMLIQEAYPGRRSFLYGYLYAGFLKQVGKRTIIIATKTDEPFYLGVDQHLGA